MKRKGIANLLFCLAALLPGCGDDGGAAVDAGATDAFIPEARAPFPAGFLFGSAMAPYQVEGGLTNTDWYQWESLCDTCSGDSAQDGPDFLTHYEADFDRAASISNNAIRIGIDWSRIFPTAVSFPDAPDADAVQLYHDILAAARSRGLRPMVTLAHFALPTWISDLNDPVNKNGWEDASIIAAFETWSGWAGTEYGAQVDLWITINEPFVNVTGGWISGDVPPGKTLDIDAGLAAGLNMVQAHARGYDALHAADLIDADGDGQAARVSIAKHNRVFLPRDADNPRQVAAAKMLSYLLNDFFLEAVVFGNVDNNFDYDFDDAGDLADDADLKGRLDYIGLNYYGVTLVIDTANDNNFPLIGLPLINDLEAHGFEAPISDFGWSLYASGLREVLDGLTRYDLPIMITENGLADAGDNLRAHFLVEHLYELERAIEDGIPVEGYFHWSLIDNFEWASGYCPRFGLFHVDFESSDKTRTIGAGAEMYKQIIDANAVEPRLFGETAYGEPGYCARVGL
jgi:beta-glucosidase